MSASVPKPLPPAAGSYVFGYMAVWQVERCTARRVYVRYVEGTAALHYGLALGPRVSGVAGSQYFDWPNDRHFLLPTVKTDEEAVVMAVKVNHLRKLAEDEITALERQKVEIRKKLLADARAAAGLPPEGSAQA